MRFRVLEALSGVARGLAHPRTPLVERMFPRDFAALATIGVFVRDFLQDNRIDAAISLNLDLVIEEIVTNMLKYSVSGRNEISVGLARFGSRLKIVFREFEVEPFDLTKTRPPDTTKPLEARRPGGVGIHIIRQVSEDIRYDYQDRTSTITVLMRIPD